MRQEQDIKINCQLGVQSLDLSIDLVKKGVKISYQKGIRINTPPDIRTPLI